MEYDVGDYLCSYISIESLYEFVSLHEEFLPYDR